MKAQLLAGDQLVDYFNEERAIQPIRKIVVNGSVDVVFKRGNKPTLVVAGESNEAIASVKTYFKGDKLVIERPGISIASAGGNHTVVHGSMVFNGPVGQVVFGSIVNKSRSKFDIVMDNVDMGFNHGKVVVGIALPDAPSINIKGRADVTLYDLHQDDLKLKIEGSGDISAFGKVDYLDAKIAGSGKISVAELTAVQACLSVTGSGDIEAFVKSDVRARVSGAGYIMVRGNPLRRDHSVTGVGDIRFSKK